MENCTYIGNARGIKGSRGYGVIYRNPKMRDGLGITYIVIDFKGEEFYCESHEVEFDDYHSAPRVCYCGKAIKTSLTINMYCDECLKLEEMKYGGFYSTLKSDQGYAVLEYSRYYDACYNTLKARRVFNGFQSAKEAEEVARTLAKVNDGWLTSFMLEGGSSITSPHPAYDKTGL